MRKNRGKEKSIVVLKSLILLSLQLWTSDIHALHRLHWCTSPLLFSLGDVSIKLMFY